MKRREVIEETVTSALLAAQRVEADPSIMQEQATEHD